MADHTKSKVGNRKPAFILLSTMLLVSLFAYVWISENGGRNLRKQAHLLGISDNKMRDKTNTGCTTWHHTPAEISQVDGCYLHTYARYESRAQESAVKERLKASGWALQKLEPNIFIMPRGVHTLDTIYFKNVKGDTYCVGIEYGEKAFNLHIFSNVDDNCKKMIGSRVALSFRLSGRLPSALR